MDKSNEDFDIPIVLMTFLRTDGALKIISVIEKIKPKKLYFLSDGPRNANEAIIIHNLRKKIMDAVTWKCNVIPIFRETNVGVYENIVGGAKEVFSKEKWAIFLEDDNLPDPTFFYFCKDMLSKYNNNDKIFWICGTNYLGKNKTKYTYDYYFTYELLPCGWASWSNKFLKYYDDDFILAQNKIVRKIVKKTYFHKALYRQQMRSIKTEIYRHAHKRKYNSWDFQLIFTLRANGFYGICPKDNLINNFGVDEASTHIIPKKTHSNVSRFCNIPSYPLPGPYRGPATISIYPPFEKQVESIILAPLRIRFFSPFLVFFRKLFGKYGK